MGGRHPSGYIVAEYLKRSTRTLQRAAVKHVRSSTRREAFDLAPSGVYQATAVTDNTGALLPHLFTLTTKVAVCFLWHYPAGHPGLPLATTLLYGVRTFLDGDFLDHKVSPTATAKLTHLPVLSVLVIPRIPAAN